MCVCYKHMCMHAISSCANFSLLCLLQNNFESDKTIFCYSSTRIDIFINQCFFYYFNCSVLDS